MTSRTARVLAIATSVSSTAAVPAVLAATGAWGPALPAPDAVRRWIAQPMGVGFVTTLTAAAAAALWLLLVTSALTHVYRVLARRWRWSVVLRLPGPIQSLTAALLGATAVTTATGAAAHAAPVTTSGDDLSAKDETAAPTPAAASRGAQDARPAAPAASTYTVRRGDSLCRIAERTLGDADRWPEIYALNRGARFPRVGGTLRDPDLIYPGWTLNLPTDPAVTAPSTPRPPTDTAPGGDTEPGEQTTPTRPAAAPTPQSTDPESAAGAGPHSPTAPSRPAGQSAGQAGADAHRRSEDASRGVGLPGGSWIDAGLACAIAAAVALVWAHRRRRYVPRAPSTLPRLDDPTLAPMPRVVGRIHRGLRAAGHQDPHEAAPLPVRDQPASGTARPDDESDIVATQVPAPVTPALASPLIAVWPPAGLGLTGPGAEAAARGFLVSALASGGLDEPNRRGRVVIPSGALVALLAAAAVGVPDTPRLTVTGGLTDALAMLEDETLRRTRVCFDYEVDTVAGVRDADPTAEPLPPMVLIADTTAAHERARIAALLAQGQRLDIHGILLGAWPDGNTVVVDTDGTTTPAAGETRHGTHPADIGRLSVLTPAETIDVFTTLAEAHTGEHRPAAPTETFRPATGQDPQPTPAGTVAVDEVDHAEDGEPDAPLSDDEPTPADSALVSHSRDPAVEEPQAGNDQSAPPGGRVAVRVLGGARIVDMDTTVPLRAKALELLVYLVVHDGDAAQDDILDDLLPDAPAAKAPHRLHTYVSALRKALARTGGPATYLTHPSRRYALNRDALDTDLWRMRDALRDAERATTHADRTAALQRAVDAYDGALADGFDYEWIEAHREGIRRQALDAHLALAAATADPARALAVLEAAIRHDPYAEALYQQAMRAHAALGHLEQIRALRRTLTRRLDEIDAEPSKDTIQLADRLITGLRQQRPTGKPDPRDGRQHP